MRSRLYTLFFLTLVLAATTGTALAVTIDTSIFKPASGGGTSPAGIVLGVYKFALAISGILAFGAIVYGATRYTVAAGNPGGQKEGREWITQALIGLVLLAGAYLILNLLNPRIFEAGGTKLRDLPALRAVENPVEYCPNGCRVGYSCYPSKPPDPNNPTAPINYTCVQTACVTNGKIGCLVGQVCQKNQGNPWPTYTCGRGNPVCSPPCTAPLECRWLANGPGCVNPNAGGTCNPPCSSSQACIRVGTNSLVCYEKADPALCPQDPCAAGETCVKAPNNTYVCAKNAN